MEGENLIKSVKHSTKANEEVEFKYGLLDCDNKMKWIVFSNTSPDHHMCLHH